LRGFIFADLGPCILVCRMLIRGMVVVMLVCPGAVLIRHAAQPVACWHDRSLIAHAATRRYLAGTEQRDADVST
jgi:hypothetical protein